MALAWNNIDLDAATLSVERSLEETKAGLRFKPPKTEHGVRTISLPPSAVAALREHRRKQLETRVLLGLGRPEPDAPVFCRQDGSLIAPSWLSYTWRNTCISLKLPKVTFHALRHTHASALIAAGVDVIENKPPDGALQPRSSCSASTRTCSTRMARVRGSDRGCNENAAATLML